MALTLTIENETTLVDGGPLSYTVTGKRGFDIGRETHLDWTLPDPSRHISGKHCEVRFRDGDYWLYDISTNGTFLNGSEGRMREPHRLRNGDRLAIGRYLIAVRFDEEREEPISAGRAEPKYDNMWQSPPPPSTERSFPAAPAAFAPSTRPDFLDWAASVQPLVQDTKGFPPSPPPMTFDANAGADANIWGQLSSRLQAPRQENTPQRENTPQFENAQRLDLAEPVARPADAGAPIFEAPPPESVSTPGPTVGQASDGAAFLRAFARGAGLPESLLEHQDPVALAERLGGLMRLTAEDVKQLLAARFEAKRMAKSANQTQIQMAENNPLKFTPSAEDALKIMFGPPMRGYLDASRTLKKSFADIKAHQVDTYSAMQAALRELVEDFDPEEIDAALGRDSGLGGILGSRKARAWDVFVTRWQAKTSRQDDGMLGVFMAYFSKHYDRGGEK